MTKFQNTIRLVIATAFFLLTQLSSQATADCISDNLTIPPSEISLGTEWELCSGMAIAFQKDGNLVVYSNRRVPIWNSETANKGAAKLVMQTDGNLVIYDNNRVALWSSNSSGNPGSYLAVQGDGNLVVYSQTGPIFDTKTSIRSMFLTDEVVDEVYCTANVYIHPNGDWLMRSSFLNGTKRDQDYYASITVSAAGQSAVIRQEHTKSLQSEKNCPGRCEGEVITSGQIPKFRPEMLQTLNATYSCRDSAPVKPITTQQNGSVVDAECVNLTPSAFQDVNEMKVTVTNVCDHPVTARLIPLQGGNPISNPGYTPCIPDKDSTEAWYPISGEGTFQFVVNEVRKCR